MTPAPTASGARTGAPTPGPLADLPAALRDEPALAQVLGRASATLAVPEAARALVTAGLSRLTKRRPIVLAVPTSTEAERLAHDLGAFLGDDRVELFPAWETLPFERVSPGVETMGRRLRVLWRLHDAERAPDVVVASVRALVQRLGPHVDDVAPDHDPARPAGRPRRPGRRPGGRRLPARGDGRAPRRAGRARLDRRRVPVDGRPARCASTCGATRSTGSPSSRCPTSGRPTTSTRRCCSRAVSCCPPTRSERGPSGWSASSRGAASSGSAWPRAWCSTAWSRGCRG